MPDQHRHHGHHGDGRHDRDRDGRHGHDGDGRHGHDGDGHRGYDGDLEVAADSLIGAAAGIDEIVSTVAGSTFRLFEEQIFVGDLDLGLALSEFSSRWAHGLQHLVTDQREVAGNLRSCVDTYFGCDHDVAAAFRARSGRRP